MTLVSIVSPQPTRGREGTNQQGRGDDPTKGDPSTRGANQEGVGERPKKQKKENKKKGRTKEKKREGGKKGKTCFFFNVFLSFFFFIFLFLFVGGQNVIFLALNVVPIS